MEKTEGVVRTYMKVAYAVKVDCEIEGGHILYFATHPELQGCMGQGDTVDEALADLEDARELYISNFVRRGLAIPMPESAKSQRISSTTSVVTTSVVLNAASATVGNSSASVSWVDPSIHAMSGNDSLTLSSN